MNTPLQGLRKEEQVAAVMHTMYQAIIAENDTKFIQWYIASKAATRDVTDQMRIDITFSEKILALRKIEFFTATAAELRKMAQEIIEENDPEIWYGKATQLATSLIGK